MAKKKNSTAEAKPASDVPQLEDLDFELTEGADRLAKHIAQASASGDNQRVVELARILGRCIKRDE